jgi:fluoride ion exporter CrcB/FEX
MLPDDDNNNNTTTTLPPTDIENNNNNTKPNNIIQQTRNDKNGTSYYSSIITKSFPLLPKMASITCWSVLGAYLRIVLDNSIPSSSPNYLASNFLGTFVLGFIDILMKTPNITVLGIGVGLCGCWTTFSSWQVSVAKSAVGLDSNVGIETSSEVYAFFSDLLIGISIPICGYYLGKHIGVGFNEKVQTQFPAMNTWIKNNYTHDMEVLIWCTMLICVCIGVCVGTGFQPNYISFSLLMAPCGALLRYGFGLYLNPLLQGNFFVGTFTSNILGTAILAGITMVQLSHTGIHNLSCEALNAVGLGFCGSLTTVSTFVKELVGGTLQKNTFAYFYGFTSVIVAQIICLAVLGGYASNLSINVSRNSLILPNGTCSKPG